MNPIHGFAVGDRPAARCAVAMRLPVLKYDTNGGTMMIQPNMMVNNEPAG